MASRSRMDKRKVDDSVSHGRTTKLVLSNNGLQIHPSKQRTNRSTRSTSREKMIEDGNSSDDFVLHVSSDEMDAIKDDCTKSKLLLQSLSAEKSQVPVDEKNFSKSNISKRRSSSPTSPKKNNTKRMKKRRRNVSSRDFSKTIESKEEREMLKLIEKFDQGMLLNSIIKHLAGEKILRAYKNSKPTKEDREEALRALDLKSQNVAITSPEKLMSLQNILVELRKIYADEDFVQVVLKTFCDPSKPIRALKHFSLDDLKTAVLKHLNASDLMDLLLKSNQASVVNQRILEKVSTEAVVCQVQLRNDLNTSEMLLSVLLKSFCQIEPEESNSDVEEKILSAVINLVSRKYVKSSDSLLNIMLRNGPKILSKKAKNSIMNVLAHKYSNSELSQLTHDLYRFYLVESNVIQID